MCWAENTGNIYCSPNAARLITTKKFYVLKCTKLISRMFTLFMLDTSQVPLKIQKESNM